MLSPKVKESVIRLMTRLSIQHNAINLSQGFPNEPPPAKVRLALAQAVLSGNVCSSDEGSRLTHATEKDLTDSLINLLSNNNGGALTDETDELNQYSPAVASYYKRLYDYEVSEENITLTLGATEAFASACKNVS